MRKFSQAEIRQNLSKIHALVHDAFPEFISHDPISKKYWDLLYSDFPQFQIVLDVGGKIAAIGNSITLYVKDYDNFANKGWDWALETAVSQARQGIKPNCLIGLSIVVNPEFAGQRLSEKLVSGFKDVAQSYGFPKVLVPIRPTKKHLYPLISFDDYVQIKLGDAYFDPWIALHERLGGKRICVCQNAMRISGSLADWEAWTGLRFPLSGDYHIAGGLVPLRIDIVKNRGYYNEPNIWYEHLVTPTNL